MSAYALFPFPSPAGKPYAVGDIESSVASSSDTSADSAKPQSTHESGQGMSIGVVIKDAKFNPVRLIQSMMQGPRAANKASTSVTPQYNNNPSNSATFKRRQNYMNSNDLQSSSTLQQQQQQQRGPAHAAAAATTSHESIRSHSSSIPHVDENAIEFDLAITFQGRKYNLKRTMQCLVNLRNALICEMNTKHKMWLPSIGVGNLTSPSPCNFVTASINLNPQAPKYQYTTTTSSLHRDATAVTIEIPEIPSILNEDHSSTGFVGRGFTMLHAMLVAYCPDVEGWLRNVMAIVPHDSESLADFLWEPITREQEQVAFQFQFSTDTGNDKAARGKPHGFGEYRNANDDSASSLLIPIQEDDKDDADFCEDQSDEEWAC